MKRKPKLKGTRDRFQIFVDGFELLRWLATDEVNNRDAVAAGINYREFYRWLGAFRRAGVGPHKTRDERGRVYYSISKSEFHAMIERGPSLRHMKARHSPLLPARAASNSFVNSEMRAKFWWWIGPECGKGAPGGHASAQARRDRCLSGDLGSQARLRGGVQRWCETLLRIELQRSWSGDIYRTAVRDIGSPLLFVPTARQAAGPPLRFRSVFWCCPMSPLGVGISRKENMGSCLARRQVNKQRPWHPRQGKARKRRYVRGRG